LSPDQVDALTLHDFSLLVDWTSKHLDAERRKFEALLGRG
jgi:hypothetical protein